MQPATLTGKVGELAQQLTPGWESSRNACPRAEKQREVPSSSEVTELPGVVNEASGLRPHRKVPPQVLCGSVNGGLRSHQDHVDTEIPGRIGQSTQDFAKYGAALAAHPTSADREHRHGNAQ